jgi:hypothetical protein
MHILSTYYQTQLTILISQFLFRRRLCSVFQRGHTRVRAIEIQRCASKSQPAAYFVCTFCRVRVVRSCALTCSPPPTTDTAFEAWRERGIPVPHFRRFARFHRRFATPAGDSSAPTDSSRRGLLPRAGGRFLPRAKLPRDCEASLRGHAPVAPSPC